MIWGARNTIVRHRPKLALRLSLPRGHSGDFQLPCALVPEYRFALRHHSPRLIVLYAWIEEGG